MRRKALFIAASWLLVVAASAAGAGEIYTWKDKEGRVNYADNPPAGSAKARTLSGKEAEAAAQPTVAAPEKAAGPKSVAEQDLDFRKRQSEAAEQKAKADKDAVAAEEKRKNCERARAQLAALDSGQRVSRPNAKGEREYLDDAQRAEEIANSRKAVESWCK